MKRNMKMAVVGAGFSGAVLARQLAKAGFELDVFESRDHAGGNCHTYVDNETGVTIHKYGPHIFHTDDESVWRYVNDFVTFKPYINRVKTTVCGKVYSMPINLHTINQFFGKAMSPKEAQLFMAKLRDVTIGGPQTFEEQALGFVGRELYEAFFKGYTQKQWGVDPAELPASILKRLPIRFNYDDNYYNHKYQGMPKNGYTPIFDKLLDTPGINLYLTTPFDPTMDYDHVFFTGSLDSWFDFKLGRLEYRTLDFVEESHEGDYQGCAVMNYGDVDIPYTRIAEHKHFAPWESHDKTVIFKEFSRSHQPGDIPYYPIRLVNAKKLLNRYVTEAQALRGVSFLGRLGTYRYLDMDVTIAEALHAAKVVLLTLDRQEAIPPFFVQP